MGKSKEVVAPVESPLEVEPETGAPVAPVPAGPSAQPSWLAVLLERLGTVEEGVRQTQQAMADTRAVLRAHPAGRFFRIGAFPWEEK